MKPTECLQWVLNNVNKIKKYLFNIKTLIFNLVNLKTKNVKGCLYKSNINFIESGLDINNYLKKNRYKKD